MNILWHILYAAAMEGMPIATCLPAIKPDSPRFGTPFICGAGQRAVLSLESPEKQRVVGMVHTIDWDTSSPIPRKRESDVR